MTDLKIWPISALFCRTIVVLLTLLLTSCSHSPAPYGRDDPMCHHNEQDYRGEHQCRNITYGEYKRQRQKNAQSGAKTTPENSEKQQP